MSYPPATNQKHEIVATSANASVGAQASGGLLFGNGRVTARTDAWGALRLIRPDTRQHLLTGAPLVDCNREHPASKAFDLLRTRLVQTLRQQGWSRVAVVAPTAGCGATFSAVNLAQSLARVPGSRSVLVDLDQRAPGVAKALGLNESWKISDFLCGRISMERHMFRASDTLALALNTEANPDASEQLHDQVSAAVLEDMEDALLPDVVLYDLPPMLEYDDAAAFLPNVDGVLLIADATQTTRRHIEKCESIIEGQSNFLGVVLNRGRVTQD
ncbi:CpsD/CapB family tyrosine-protein kinase [Roseovarius sp. A21]|uniref:CpsD/CapB family tyrosine-protein kinase n=1 Tax=Roseovarius bejariae TaxID=2576383 RepID=A0A844D1K5_9RHOB|nr:CpsD/CapB family tyrosine-protein kinase [Roseovarius bejariae]MRU16104.1 CpsD/CapB family tyrosine-protein kinase [Roseovarius bejariae]